MNRMFFIDSVYNPFLSTSLVQENFFLVASPWYSTLAQWNSVMYSTGKCVCERLSERERKRHCRISSGARYQLHCKWIQPVLTAFLLPSGMKLSIRCSSPQQGEGIPPGWKLSDTSAKAIGGGSECPVSPDYVLFSSIYSLLNGFFLLLPLQFACYVALPRSGIGSHRMDAGKEAEWGEPLVLALRRSLSLSLSLAFTLPRTCLLPASSLHLPTLSFSLSSSPSLSYTHTHRHTLL